jgi:hypothetical protein
MSYIDEKVGEGEQVVFRTKRHPAVLLFPIILLALSVAIFGPAGLGLILAILAACWLAVGLAARSSEFGVTDKRLLMRVGGVICRRELDIPLENLDSFDVRQSALGAKIGYGTVVVRENNGTSSSFPTVQQCVEFKERVQEQIGRNKRAGNRVTN